MERLDRQRMIPDWDQSLLSTATVGVKISGCTDLLLADAFLRGSVMIGLGRVVLAGEGCRNSLVQEQRRFSESIHSL